MQVDNEKKLPEEKEMTQEEIVEALTEEPDQEVPPMQKILSEPPKVIRARANILRKNPDLDEISTGKEGKPEELTALLNGNEVAIQDQAETASKKLHRKIKLKYTKEDVGPQLFNQILTWYSIGNLTMRQIRTRANEKRAALNLSSLEFHDIYSLLYRVIVTENGGSRKITERTRIFGEYTVKEYAKFFKAWRDGHKKMECVGIAKPESGVVSKSFQDIIHRSLAAAWKRSKSSDGRTSKEKRDQIFYDLFTYAKIVKVDGRDMIVIDPTEVPIDYLQEATTVQITGDLIKKALVIVKAGQVNPEVEPAITTDDPDDI